MPDAIVCQTLKHRCLEKGKCLFELAKARGQEKKISQMYLPSKSKSVEFLQSLGVTGRGVGSGKRWESLREVKTLGLFSLKARSKSLTQGKQNSLHKIKVFIIYRCQNWGQRKGRSPKHWQKGDCPSRSQPTG